MNPEYARGYRYGRKDAQRGHPRPEYEARDAYWSGYFQGYDSI